jgi:hypothetical protein
LPTKPQASQAPQALFIKPPCKTLKPIDQNASKLFRCSQLTSSSQKLCLKLVVPHAIPLNGFQRLLFCENQISRPGNIHTTRTRDAFLKAVTRQNQPRLKLVCRLGKLQHQEQRHSKNVLGDNDSQVLEFRML